MSTKSLVQSNQFNSQSLLFLCFGSNADPDMWAMLTIWHGCCRRADTSPVFSASYYVGRKWVKGQRSTWNVANIMDRLVAQEPDNKSTSAWKAAQAKLEKGMNAIITAIEKALSRSNSHLIHLTLLILMLFFMSIVISICVRHFCWKHFTSLIFTFSALLPILSCEWVCVCRFEPRNPSA